MKVIIKIEIVKLIKKADDDTIIDYDSYRFDHKLDQNTQLQGM